MVAIRTSRQSSAVVTDSRPGASYSDRTAPRLSVVPSEPPTSTIVKGLLPGQEVRTAAWASLPTA